ncbi:MAG: hypothetical protein IPK44_09090 [Candidatus Accumulibacter sp.]|uniref:hypothetical protein n=1 Tax=Accumulibacter sp. TaxID=2053492 RepID=UPI002582AFF1|nr:hypothetical protein [Accumulibacter sp.]MBK8114664.1 hypothetical protein [Accumulibacter sp.]
MQQSLSRRAEILRWIAVLPGALAAVVIVLFPIHWTVMLIEHLGTSTDDSGSGSPLSLWYYLAKIDPEVLELFGNAFFAPIVLISVGARIAPKFKFFTGIALAVALGVFYGVAATSIADDISEGLYTPERWLRLAITVCLQIGGVIAGLFLARKVERKSQGAAAS